MAFNLTPLGDEEPHQSTQTSTSMTLQPSPFEAYECQERIRQMSNALDNRLNEEQRKLFLLHHLQEVSISEIARRLDKSEDAIKSNLYRTRKLLFSQPAAASRGS